MPQVFTGMGQISFLYGLEERMFCDIKNKQANKQTNLEGERGTLSKGLLRSEYSSPTLPE